MLFRFIHGDAVLDVALSGAYSNGRPCLDVTDEDGAVRIHLTVNIPEVPLRAGEVCIKDWSENTSIVHSLMIAPGFDLVFVPTGEAVQTGHVEAPIWSIPHLVTDVAPHADGGCCPACCPEWLGHIDDASHVEPRCDICGEPQDCGRDLCLMHGDDWDGDKGEHRSCQTMRESGVGVFVLGSFDRIIG
jgi:hypothetical protein